MRLTFRNRCEERACQQWYSSSMNALEMRPPDTLALADIASIAEVNNMVVAVDFSSMTHAVLNAAVILAGQRKDARVTLLFVIPEDNYVVGDIGVIRGPFAMNKRDAAMDELKKLRATQFQASTNVDVMVREGFPATEICDTADERGADLIVVASHGRTGLNRIMMGSTAEEVVHGARCSVMIVKPAEAKGNPGKLPGLHDVAVAFDGSSSSRAALATALKLVRHGTTSLHLIQAVWPFPIASGDIPIETDEVRVQDAQEELTRVCDQIPGSLHIKSGTLPRSAGLTC